VLLRSLSSAMGENKVVWADEVEDDNTIPNRTESAPDENGIKTIVEWRLNADGRKVKTTTRVKVTKMIVRVNKNVEARLANWVKFGPDQAPSEEGKSVTNYATEEVFVDKPQQRGEVKKRDEVSKIVNFNDFQARLERRKRGELPPSEPTKAQATEAKSDATSGKYVPPSLRAGGDKDGSSMNRTKDRDDSALKVSNLSDDMTEEDLENLFSKFGDIARVFIAKHRSTNNSRGFGFVNFFKKSDAEFAMGKMEGKGFNSLIMHVEWARPQADKE